MASCSTSSGAQYNHPNLAGQTTATVTCSFLSTAAVSTPHFTLCQWGWSDYAVGWRTHTWAAADCSHGLPQSTAWSVGQAANGNGMPDQASCTPTSGAQNNAPNAGPTVSQVYCLFENNTAPPPPSPVVASLSPTAGTVGQVVTITGSNFGATAGNSRVTFNGTQATPSAWSTTSITAPVPTGATTGSVVVTVGNLASNGVTFTVQTPPPASATFVRTDTTTQGSWKGVYGVDGTVLVNDSTMLPNYATLNAANASTWTWAQSTTDVRALQKLQANDRIAATWYGSSFPLDLNLTDGGVHQVGLYVVDWDSAGRSETLEVHDAVTNAVLDTRTVTGFQNGQYWIWNIKGHVTVNVVGTAGPNAVVSGLFLDPNPQGPPPPNHVLLSPASATQVVGGTQTFTATAYDASNNPVAATFTWTLTPTTAGTLTTSASTATVTHITASFTITAAVTGGSPTGSATLNAVSAPAGTGDVRRSTDFDADGKADITVYRPGNGTWYTLTSQSGYATQTSIAWGTSTDLPVPGDYDGDGKADPAFFRPSTGEWKILKSSTNFTTSVTITLGVRGDVPVPGDYDGDGKTDAAVFHAATAQWKVLNSTTGTVTTTTFGTSTDIPVPGDYDGDGKTDLGVWDPAAAQPWRILKSTTQTQMTATLGVAGDIPVSGDYDGDGKVDVAVYHPATAQWQILKSSNLTQMNVTLGSATDVPVPADYDGDGKVDPAIFRPSTGQWLIATSSSSYQSNINVTLGTATDVAAPRTTRLIQPVVALLTPTSEVVGHLVTITGSRFSASQGASAVTFNGVAAAVSSWSSTSIAVSVPAGASSGPVVVNVGGVESNGIAFSVLTNSPVTSTVCTRHFQAADPSVYLSQPWSPSECTNGLPPADWVSFGQVQNYPTGISGRAFCSAGATPTGAAYTDVNWMTGNTEMNLSCLYIPPSSQPQPSPGLTICSYTFNEFYVAVWRTHNWAPADCSHGLPGSYADWTGQSDYPAGMIDCNGTGGSYYNAGNLSGETTARVTCVYLRIASGPNPHFTLCQTGQLAAHSGFFKPDQASYGHTWVGTDCTNGTPQPYAYGLGLSTNGDGTLEGGDCGPNLANHYNASSYPQPGRMRCLLENHATPPLTPGDPCGWSVNPGSVTFPAEGGYGFFQVTALPNCHWTSGTNAFWTSPQTTDATGPAVQKFAVDRNDTGAARTGQIQFWGDSGAYFTFTVVQSPTFQLPAGQIYIWNSGINPACTYAVTPASTTASSAGTSGSASVSTQSGCAWGSASQTDWLHVTSPATGTGNSAVTYAVDPNPTQSQRTGTIVIANRAITITEDGTPATPPGFSHNAVSKYGTTFYFMEQTQVPTTTTPPNYPLFNWNFRDQNWWNTIVQRATDAHVGWFAVNAWGQQGPDGSDTNFGGADPGGIDTTTNPQDPTPYMLKLTRAIDAAGGGLKVALFDDTHSEVWRKNRVKARGFVAPGEPGVCANNDPACFFDLSPAGNTIPSGEGGWYYFYDQQWKRFFNNVPAKYWFRIKDRPVVIMWLGTTLWYTNASYFSDMIAALKEQTRLDFGFVPYVIVEKSWIDLDPDAAVLSPDARVGVDAAYQWFNPDILPVPLSRTLWSVNGVTIGHLIPGYDYTPPPPDPTPRRFVDRRNGDLYRENLDYVKGADLVMIESINNLLENAEIIDSVGANPIDLYLAITLQFAVLHP
jgi:hypothetical protein